ncbi:MAG TPA: response regulator [Myxococcota bacterium]|nr:response regulator [Myxococcota bacterium]
MRRPSEWPAFMRALEARIEAAFVPPRLRGDPVAARSATLVAGFSFLPMAFVPLLAALEWIAFPPALAYRLAAIVLACVPMCGAVPFVLRFTGSTKLAGNWMLAYGFATLTVLTYYAGGPVSPPSFWNVLVPMTAVALVSRRWAIFWAALVVAEAGSLAWLEHHGLVLQNQILPEWRSLHWLVSIGSLATLVTLAGLVFERNKELSLRTLEKANGELAHARDEAERASESKSDFLATLTHEVRTPMTAILGFADVLRDEWREKGFEARHVDALAIIQRNGRQLLETINDLLDLSKIEAGKLELERISFSPSELVAGLVEPLRAQAAARGVALEFERVPPLPGLVRSDPARLRQVAARLVENALRFTQRGSVKVSLGVARENGETCLDLRVRDTGRGIAPERLESLFLPGMRGATESGGTERMGLGLTMCKRLIELLGGRIEVESELGAGSTFRVLVPYAATEETVVLETGEPRPLAARVLVVDDGPDNLRLISHLLRRAGSHVETATDGRAALDAVAEAERVSRPFDVVLMDMQMPGLDGYEATAELRRRGFAQPVIALTAHAVPGTRESCLAAGCDDFATKPVDRRELIQRIRRLCPHLD